MTNRRNDPVALAAAKAGFDVHTFRPVDAGGEGRFVKFHWKPVLGVGSTTWDEAVKIPGADPDFYRRDLFEAIVAGDHPHWDLGIQVFDEAWAAKQPYDVLEPARLIPEDDIPVIVGRMTLDRNVDNLFAETEQAAFLPTNIVPGPDFSAADGLPLVLFDAVAAGLTSEQAQKLTGDAAAVQWFMDAYGHCKTVAHTEGCKPLLDRAGVEPYEGVVPIANSGKAGTHRQWTREPKVRDLA